DRLNVERQLNLYRDHHTAAGVREVLSAWITPLRGQSIAEKLDPDTGKGLDLELPDGGVISVYFGGGQGAALADFSTVSAADAEDGQAVLDELVAIRKGALPEDLVRRVGPVKISLVTAPEEVVLAVAKAIAREDGAMVRPETFVKDVLKARQSE